MSGLDLYLSQGTLARMLVFAAVAGFCLGGVYDVSRILCVLCRACVPPARGGKGSTLPLATLRFLTDVLFCITAAATLILLCYYTNDGQLRAPAVIGMACGFFVYIHTLSHLVMWLAEKIIPVLLRTVARILRLLSWPLRLLWHALRPVLILLRSHTIGRVIAAHRRRKTNADESDQDPASPKEEKETDPPPAPHNGEEQRT